MSHQPERKGVLPTPTEQASIALVVMADAHNIAREQAAQGVPPEFAAPHAARAADFRLSFWLSVGFVTLVLSPLQFAGPVIAAWYWILAGLAVVIYLRLQTYVRTPGDKMVRYPIPTAFLVLAWVLWLVVLVVGGLAYLWFTL